MPKYLLGVYAPVAPPPPATLEITTSSIPSGVEGSAYPTTTFQAIGGTGGPYTWGLVPPNNALPVGMNFSIGGILSGTPTSTGTFNIIVSVDDGVNPQATSGIFALQITAAGVTLSVVTSSINTANRGVAYPSQTLQAQGGSGAGYTWSLVAPNNVLPAGMTFIAGVLSGTPTEDGTFPLQFKVVDSLAAEALSGTINLIVAQVANLTISTNSPLTQGEVGTAYSRTLQHHGGWGPYTWSLTGTLPGGLSLNTSTGLISGTPTTVETRSFTIGLVDSEARSTSKVLEISIVAVGTAELPYDYYDEWHVHETIYQDIDFRMSAASLQALQNTPAATGGPWLYDYAGDSYVNKQDALKLTLDSVRATDGQPTWSESTAFQLYIPISPAVTYPDKLLMTWDWYWNADYFDNSGNVYGYKMWQFRPGRSNGLWTLCHSRTASGWRYVDSIRSNVRDTESLPNGMIDAGNDRVVPLGAGVAYSQAKYIDAYPVNTEVWTRYWLEVRFARPHTEFTSWNNHYGVTLQENYDDMSGDGRWHMLSMWAARENGTVERIMYQIPMGWWGRLEGAATPKVIDSGTINSLTDTGVNLGNTNTRVGQKLQVRFADGSRDFRVISANTSTSITVSAPFSQVPQAGDVYWTDHWEPEITHFTYEINTSKCCPIGTAVAYARPFMAFKNYPLSDANPEDDPIFRVPVRG